MNRRRRWESDRSLLSTLKFIRGKSTKNLQLAHSSSGLTTLLFSLLLILPLFSVVLALQLLPLPLYPLLPFKSPLLKIFLMFLPLLLPFLLPLSSSSSCLSNCIQFSSRFSSVFGIFSCIGAYNSSVLMLDRLRVVSRQSFLPSSTSLSSLAAAVHRCRHWQQLYIAVVTGSSSTSLSSLAAARFSPTWHGVVSLAEGPVSSSSSVLAVSELLPPGPNDWLAKKSL